MRISTINIYFPFAVLGIICFLIISCQNVDRKNNGDSLDAVLSNASWIESEIETLPNDSLLYNDHPAPLFRKEIELNKEIQSAKLLITAAGYYRASINGQRIGKNYLDPAWTDFSKRIYFSEYDVTELVIEGSNCMGVMLGNGFYNPLPLKMWGNRNLRNELPIGNPCFIASLKVDYKNGDKVEFVSDASWKYFDGPILKNNVYLGEWFDARKNINRWDEVGVDDTNWEHAKVSAGPGGKLQKAFFPAVQITEQISPVSVSSQSATSVLVDMGVNFTGIYNVRLKGNKDDTITIRLGERIYEDGSLNPMTAVVGQIKRAGQGGPGAPAFAIQEDNYIMGEDTEIWYRPEFTFHTFKYMEISGIKYTPELTDIQGLLLNSDVAHENSFVSSSDLVNSIQEATVRTFLSNLVSVQSDCAAREKFGYGGDLIATSEAFIYNFDMQDFYRKTIYDWVDVINDSVFVDTAPNVGIRYCGLSWESAFIITQYSLYLYYNDTTIIEELYDLNLKWMDKAARLHPNGIVDKGLSDHESLEPVPVELTGTGHYLQCARIMQVFAKHMEDEINQARFRKLASSLQAILLEKFWRTPVTESINEQTLLATLLYHDVIPEDEVETATDLLLIALDEAESGHFTTGIFGTKYILEILSQTGHVDEVYNIVNSTEYPGWGHMIDRGATTIWETWKESDNTYSNCHPMFGSVTEWMYRWLGGIQPDPAFPGFERFFIIPNIPDDLSIIESSYQSPFGKIKSNWRRDGVRNQTFEMLIPEGSVAIVKLKVNVGFRYSVTRNGVNYEIDSTPDHDNLWSFEFKAGSYLLHVSN